MDHTTSALFPWGDHRRYHSYKNFLTRQFGKRVQKLTIDAGFTCPNRDGTVGYGGCSYCLNDAFNPSYCSPKKSVRQQLEEGIEFHRNRYKRADGYLAYFQAYSNTYAPLEELKKIYHEAVIHPEIKGIVIGTRPDCMDEEKLEYFARLQEKFFVSLEYGIESIHNPTLSRINRGHTFEQASDMLEKTSRYGIHTGAHFIFGLPGENPEIWKSDLTIINQLPVKSIKFHQLQIIKDTAMEKEYFLSPESFHLFTMDEYIEFIVDYTERLNPCIVIERFAGEVPPKFLAAGDWGTVRYDVVLQKIEKKLEEKDTFQGKKYSG